MEVADDIELHNRFDLLTQFLSGDHCNDGDYNSECSDDSVCSNDPKSNVSNGSERSRQRREPRQNQKPKQSEPSDRRKGRGITPEMRRRNSEYAERRIKCKVERMSALDVALYL